VIVKPTSSFSFFLILTLITTRYGGDTFNWQTLEAGMLKVHWYEGDEKFGRDALGIAQAALESIGSFVPVSLEQPVEIFIYATPDDLQGELVAGTERWVAGHADPVLGTIRVVIEPGAGQEIAMKQRIPHELMHVMLYRLAGEGYHNIPAWLREGTATLAELHPNAEYDRVLDEAVAMNALIPLKDMCVSFPANTSRAFLAYAESGSFVSYLHKTYGSIGLQNLAVVYAKGLDCERGTERAFGVSLSGLESQWRSSTFGQNAVSSTFQNISPYLVLLCLVLIIPLVGIAGTLRKRNSP
jgi:hypothetical protein